MTYIRATELNDRHVSYPAKLLKWSAMHTMNQGPPLMLQVGIDGWKVFIVLCRSNFPLGFYEQMFVTAFV